MTLIDTIIAANLEEDDVFKKLGTFSLSRASNIYYLMVDCLLALQD
jgi:hypothetical protein